MSDIIVFVFLTSNLLHSSITRNSMLFRSLFEANGKKCINKSFCFCIVFALFSFLSAIWIAYFTCSLIGCFCIMINSESKEDDEIATLEHICCNS